MQNRIFESYLSEEDIYEIVSLKMQNKETCIYWKIDNCYFAEYAIAISNRIGAPCVLIFTDQSVYFDVLKVWLKQLNVTIRVEPFFSVVQLYVMSALGLSFVKEKIDIDSKRNQIVSSFCGQIDVDKIISESFACLSQEGIDDFMNVLLPNFSY